MEFEEITRIVVHYGIHILLGQRRVDHQVLISDVGAGERQKREVPPDVVRARIRDEYVFEPAGRDLIIVGGVTPTTEAGTRIIEQFRVVDIMCIWVKTTAMGLVMTPTSVWCEAVENT